MRKQINSLLRSCTLYVVMLKTAGVTCEPHVAEFLASVYVTPAYGTRCCLRLGSRDCCLSTSSYRNAVIHYYTFVELE